MIDIEGRLPDRGNVAVLANIRRLYVRDAFTGCFNAVVTTDTIANDIQVIENCRNPRRRIMAIIALVTRYDVSRRFSSGLKSVVAGGATSRYRRVVHKNNDAPRGRDMAVRTLACRLYVVCRFRGCADQSARRVATFAARLGCAKRCADMAGLAGDACVSAVKHESSTKMIKPIVLCVSRGRPE